MTVLDIGTSMGDGAQLGHASSLHAGQSVPPASTGTAPRPRRTEVDYRPVAPRRVRRPAKGRLPALQLLNVLVSTCLSPSAALILLLTDVPQLRALLDPGPAAFASRRSTCDALVVSPCSSSARCSSACSSCAPCRGCSTSPSGRTGSTRSTASTTGSTARSRRLTNIKFFIGLFGDSSYIVDYLRWIGYDLARVEQTGSNFGTAVQARHPVPARSAPGRWSPTGCRSSTRTTRHVVPGVPGVDRRAQLLGNDIAYPHRAARATTACSHEGDGPDRRTRPRRRRPARLARLRDPAIGRARQPLRVGTRDELRRRLAGQEPAQPAHDGAVPAGPVAATSSWLTLLGAGRRSTSTDRSAPWRSRWPRRHRSLFTLVYFVLGRTPRRRLPAAAAPVLLDLRPELLAARALLECPRAVPPRSSTARRSRTSSGGCSASGSAAGLRRRLRHHRADAVTIGDDVHPQRGHHPPVPLAGGRRLQVRPHVHRRGRAPLGVGAFVHYGVTSATAPCSLPTPS